MKIIALYISQYYKTGGHKRYLEILNGLTERGHRVHLFLRKDHLIPKEVLTNIILTPIECKKGLFQQRRFTKALKKLPRDYWNKMDYDMVLLFGESSVLSGIFIKNKLNIPLVIALRNNFYIAQRLCHNNSLKGKIFNIRNRLKEILIKTNSELIIFQNEYDRDSYINRNSYLKGRTEIIPNSIRASWFVDSLRGTNSSTSLKNILFIGSNDRRKGFHLLLEALSELRLENYDFNLTVVGSFPETDRKEMPDWVFMKGHLKSPLELLAQSDLLIAPSLYDSFPNTVLEALFVGTPVIGTDIAGIKTILHHEELLFEGGNIKDICHILKPLFNNDEYMKVKALCHNRLPLFDFDWIVPWEKVLTEHSSVIKRD
jgi:glycosyltransferase involved in cell wall biosynthesis